MTYEEAAPSLFMTFPIKQQPRECYGHAPRNFIAARRNFPLDNQSLLLCRQNFYLSVELFYMVAGNFYRGVEEF